MRTALCLIAVVFMMSQGQGVWAQNASCEKMLEDALKTKGLSMADLEDVRWVDDIQADDSNRTHYVLAKPKACGEGQFVAAFTEGCTNMLKMFTRRGCELPGIDTRKTF